MKNFLIRSVSGIVLAAVLIGAILWSDLSRGIVFSLIALFAMKEIFSLIIKGGKIELYAGGALTITSLVVILVTYQVAVYMIVPVFILLILVRFITEVYRKCNNPLVTIGCEITVLLYLLLPTALLIKMDAYTVIFILAMVWGNDVGAYIIGILFGKHRLLERVSPKKSWEGFWGGFITTIAISIIAGKFFFNEPILKYAIIGAVVSVAAVYGDLFESLIKRELHVKDSGNVIPGHGGIWDRFDALYFAAPAYFIVDWVFSVI